MNGLRFMQDADGVLPSFASIAGIRPSRGFIENNVRAYFSCVDAAWREVFFSDAAVLIALRERWPFAEPIDLPGDAFFD